MEDLTIGFSVSPWLLLLMIPAVAIILSMFLFARRRGKLTVNRIVSAILQCAAVCLVIFAISGIYSAYDEINSQNELVILVDSSFTTRETMEETNEFVYEVLKENNGRTNIGIVTFGYDQNIVVEMGDHNPDRAYQSYLDSLEDLEINDTATDIAAALQFVWNTAEKKSEVIRYPETAKILLISDGLETDQSALAAIRSITLDGIKVDTTFFTAGSKEDAAITAVEFPDRSLTEGEKFEFKVRLKSSYADTVELRFEDRDEEGNVKFGSVTDYALSVGSPAIPFTHTFDTPGYHELKFTLTSGKDVITENNVFYSYYDVAQLNRILIIEKYEGESAQLAAAITKIIKDANAKYMVEVKQIEECRGMTLADISRYSEVILYNVNDADMGDFQDVLYDYVYDLGGGLFTVGGFEKDAGGNIKTDVNKKGEEVPVAHGYSESIEGSTYASMLPVSIEPYTPAVGVVFLVDISSSMMGANLWRAAQETKYCLDLLSPRDYVGLVFLSAGYTMEETMIPMTRRNLIEKKLESIEDAQGGDTNYEPGITQSVNMLSTLPANVTKRHIVFLTDGGPGDPLERYSAPVKNANEKFGLTMSVIIYYQKRVGDEYQTAGSFAKKDEMEKLAECGQGSVTYIQQANHWMPNEKLSKDDMKAFYEGVEADLKLDELSDIEISDFIPKIGNHTDVLGDITESDLSAMTLNGYFPSRAKQHGDVQVALLAESSPLYAFWELGNGKVGSMMIDLEGKWSQNLLEKEKGIQLLGRIVTDLFMKVEIPNKTLDLTLTEDNYRTQVNVYGFDPEMESEYKLVAVVEPPPGSDDVPTTFDLSKLSSTQNRFVFENLSVGIYTIYVLKVGQSLNMDRIKSIDDISNGDIAEKLTAYRAFSYSREYDQSLDPFTAGQNLLMELSTRELKEEQDPIEKFVYDAELLFEDYSETHIVNDPRQALLISALVLFLVGIFLRKFKIMSHKQIKTVIMGDKASKAKN